MRIKQRHFILKNEIKYEYSLIRMLLIILLILKNCTCNANWIEFQKSEKQTEYLDLENMAVSEGKIILWKLFDYPSEVNILGVKFRSRIVIHEINCIEKKLRYLADSMYNEHMGIGSSTSANFYISDPWRLVDFAKGDQAEWKAACTHEKYTNQKKKSG